MKFISYILVLLSLSHCTLFCQEKGAKRQSEIHSESVEIQCDTTIDKVIKPYKHGNDVLCDDYLILSRKIEDYYIQVTRIPNSNVITKVYSNGEYQRYADNTLYLTVHHNAKVLFKNKMFTKETFDNIPPEELQRNQLMPTNYFEAKVENDTLKTWFHMLWPDTDIGHHIFITVSHQGDVSYHTIEDNGGEGQVVEW